MFRAEVLKVRSYKLPWMVFGVFAVVQVLALLYFVIADIPETAAGEATRIPFLVTGLVGWVFAVIFGAWMGGAEFGWGTWRVVLARDSRRTLHLANKYAVFAVVTIVGTLAATLVGLLMSLLAAIVHSVSPSFDSLAVTFAASLLAVLAYGSVAFAIGVITRSTAAGIAIGLAGFLILEQLLGIVRQIRPWLLSSALDDINAALRVLSLTSRGPGDAGSPVHAWLTLAVWLAVFLGAAWLLFTRRDLAG